MPVRKAGADVNITGAWRYLGLPLQEYCHLSAGDVGGRAVVPAAGPAGDAVILHPADECFEGMSHGSRKQPVEASAFPAPNTKDTSKLVIKVPTNIKFLYFICRSFFEKRFLLNG